jgi:hypothetical protein
MSYPSDFGGGPHPPPHSEFGGNFNCSTIYPCAFVGEEISLSRFPPPPPLPPPPPPPPPQYLRPNGFPSLRSETEVYNETIRREWNEVRDKAITTAITVGEATAFKYLQRPQQLMYLRSPSTSPTPNPNREEQERRKAVTIIDFLEKSHVKLQNVLGFSPSGLDQPDFDNYLCSYQEQRTRQRHKVLTVLIDDVVVFCATFRTRWCQSGKCVERHKTESFIPCLYAHDKHSLRRRNSRLPMTYRTLQKLFESL